MKKISNILFLIIFHLVILSNISAQEITWSNSKNVSGISVNMTMDSYEIISLNHKGEEMHEISVSGSFIPNDEGMPNLPRVSRFIAIPTGAEVNLVVKNIETKTHNSVNVAPTLKVQAIPEEPVTDYVKNDIIYSKNEFYPKTPYEVSEVTSLRGIDVVVLGITPFQYNPVTKELVAVKNIELEIEFIGGTKQFGNEKYRSPWFDPIIKNALLNYEVLPEIEYSGKSPKDGEGCEYLIVIPNNEAFRPYAEQIKDFRTKQGIYTKVMSLEEMGVTSTIQMKSYFHNAYNNWDIPPVAVLLMADHNTNMSIGIPAEVIPHSYSGSCITDNQYADVNGDYLPDMVFGRMAAENENQLAVLVSKFLEYETQPCMEPSYYKNPITALGWQTERWFQICSEVAGGYWRNQGKTPVRINDIYSGTPGNSWSTAQNTSTVVNYFGPSGRGYIPATPSELGGWTGGNATQVINAVNSGAFALQHRDHGYEDGWGEPSFNSSHISQLNNVGKMTYLFTINCLTGKFNNYTPCFGEVFHRHTYQGQNAGCVGFLAPTEVSYSFVNDAFVWGMYDLYDPNFLPDFGPFADNSGNWLPAFGNVSGKYFLHQSSWPYNSDSKIITYQMFTAHSDVFLRLYTEVPQTLQVSHTDVSLAGNTNFLISATEGATIALTADGEIIAVETATGAQQTIIIPATLVPQTEITIVCTKQNYLRYETTVMVVPAEGPYVIGFEWTVNDENGDDILQYGETALIDMIAKNVGVETAENVIMTISSESEYVTILYNSIEFGPIEPDATLLIEDAFEILISQDAPNNTVISFDISSTDGDDVWASAMSVRVFRPILNYKEFSWQGSFEPGETLALNVTFENKGGAPVHDVIGVINSLSPDVTIISQEQNFGQIPQDQTGSAIFIVSINEEAQTSSTIGFIVSVAGDDGNITGGGTFTIENKCPIFIEMFDSYGDGWNGNGRISIRHNGLEIASARLPSGSYLKEEFILPAVELEFVWIKGSYDSENSFKIYNKDNELLYTSFGTPNAGTFFTYDNTCSTTVICDVPTNINAEVEEYTVLLSWESDTDNFIIKRDETIIGTASDNEFTEFDVPVGTYVYSVIAICESGAMSEENNITVEVEDAYMPITELYPTLDDNNIYLSWEAPNFNKTENITYVIYKNDEEIANVIETFYSDERLVNGDYIYCIEAVYDNEFVSRQICTELITISICETLSEINVILTENNVSLSWETPVNAYQNFNVYRNDELIETITDSDFTDYELPNGYYEYCVEVVYDYCLSEKTCSAVDVIVCHVPLNFDITAENNTVILSWESPEYDTPTGYNIFKNDNLLIENFVGETYVDETPIMGLIVYGVNANYNLECENSEVVSKDIFYIGITNISNQIKIYPNPTSSMLNIEADDDMSKILLYNNAGQLVLKLDVDGNYTNIDVSGLNSGVYSIDIIKKDNSSIKSKFVIVK